MLQGIKDYAKCAVRNKFIIGSYAGIGLSLLIKYIEHETGTQIPVICPERSESAAWRGAEAKPSTAEFQRSPKIFCCRSFFLRGCRRVPMGHFVRFAGYNNFISSIMNRSNSKPLNTLVVIYFK